MPFGCYRGRALSALPDPYLVWVTSRELSPELRTAIEREILRRVGAGRERVASKVRAVPSRDVAEDLIEAGRRALARRHHPDHGGDHDEMVNANNAADWLRDQVRRIA
jgi:hypothetical protein